MSSSPTSADDGPPTPAQPATLPGSELGLRAPRPSTGPRRLHPAWIVLGAVPTLRALAVPLMVVLVTGDSDRELRIYAIGLGLALVGVVLRIGEWWQLRYEVADGELRIRSGLVARRERLVPLERIHAVDVSESLLQRLVGVVRVRIETAAAGTSDSDVTLEALARDAATELRARLVAGRQPTSEPAAASPDRVGGGGGRLIRAMSLKQLLLAGVTAGQVGPALALVFGTVQVVDDLLPAWLFERLATVAAGSSLRVILAVAVLVGLTAWLLAVISTVLTYGGFELRRDGDRLLISAGLLDRRRSSIPLARVQAVVISEGVLRQPFGLAAVRIESAGHGRDAAESGVLFPLVHRSEVSALLSEACPAFATDLNAALAPLPRRARRRYVVEQTRGAVVTTVMAVGAAALLPWTPWWWGLFAVGLTSAAAVLGLLRYRDTGWALDDADRLTIRGRTIGRTTTITSRRRLQRREISRHFLQRRAQLATFRAAIAPGGSGGRLAIKHLDESVAFDLLARLGPARRTSRYPGVTEPA